MVLLAVCSAIGLGMEHFTDKVHWVTGGLIALFAICANGIFISVEDREPGGWDYDENETQDSGRDFQKLNRIHIAVTICILVLGVCSHFYLS